MEPVVHQDWFLCKYSDGTVFGPLAFEQVRRWADAAQIAPQDKISHDQESWLKAPMFPELEMDWLVEVTSERYYGPTTLGAVREFMRLGEISEETFLINSCDGSRRQIKNVADLLRQPNESSTVADDAPRPTPMAINLRERINDLEQSLFEERRALEESEARYRDLEAQYQMLLDKQSVPSEPLGRS